MKNNFELEKRDLNCRLCGDHLKVNKGLLTCPILNNSQDTSRSEYRDLFRDRIDKLTVITKLLKRKYGDFIDHVSRQQSRFATGVTVNVGSIVDVDDAVEME